VAWPRFYSDKFLAVIPTNRLVLFAPRGAFERQRLAVCECVWHTWATAALSGGVPLREARHRKDRSLLLQ